jgi:hypothetical protein
MASSREAFSIGDIQCVAISDGTFSYPVEWIFSNAPKEQLLLPDRMHRGQIIHDFHGAETAAASRGSAGALRRSAAC